MALNPLTISISSGVIGRRFVSAVSGISAGTIVEIASGSTQGYGYVNGKLSHSALPYDTSLVILRERNPLTGESRLTNFVITAVGMAAVKAQADALVPGNKGYRVAGVPQGDGSLVWTVFVEASTGGTSSAAIGVGSIAVSIGGVAPPALIGSPYSFTPATANGSGTKVFAYSGTSLLGFGLLFNTATGAITGTVTGSAGTISGTIVVTDSSGTASLPITIVVGSDVLAGRAIEYAQGMGATDADGYVTAFPLKSDNVARRVWVDAVNGNDANNGFSPYAGQQPNGTGTYGQIGATGVLAGTASGYGPKATLNGAWLQTVADKVGHQILLCEGQTFSEPSSWVAPQLNNVRGESVAYPRCIRSYDPSDPFNETKLGRAKGTNKPKYTPASGTTTLQSMNFTRLALENSGNGNFVWQGIWFTNLDPEAVCTMGMSGGNIQNILMEGCIAYRSNPGVGGNGAQASNAIFRKSSMGMTNDAIMGGHSQAFGSGHVDGVVVEDCILYMGGVGSRDPNYIPSAAIANFFNHNWYNSWGSYDSPIGRRNLCVEGSSSGFSTRGSAKYYHNVFLDNPIQVTGGGSVSDPAGGYSTENPNGVLFQYEGNLLMGGIDMTNDAGGSRGQGFDVQNGVPGSCVKGNLCVNHRVPNTGNGYSWRNTAQYPQPSYCEFKGNHFYAFHNRLDGNTLVPPMLRNSVGVFTSVSAAPYILTDAGTLRTSFAAIASPTDNLNSATAPATNQQIYAALGYNGPDQDTNKAALMNDAFFRPEEPWAYRVLTAVSPLFNNFDFQLTTSTLSSLVRAPSAPRALTVTGGNGRLLVSVGRIPQTNGGSDLLSYVFTATPVGGGAVITATVAANLYAPPTALLTGTANGVSYSVTCRAVNAVGPGPESVAATGAASATGTPLLDDSFQGYGSVGLNNKIIPAQNGVTNGQTYSQISVTLITDNGTPHKVQKSDTGTGFYGNIASIGVDDMRVDVDYTTQASTGFYTCAWARGAAGSTKGIFAAAVSDGSVIICLPNGATTYGSTPPVAKATANTAALAALGLATAGTHTISCEVNAKVINAYLDNILVCTYTMTDAETAVTAGQQMAGMAMLGKNGGQYETTTTRITHLKANMI